MNKRPNSYQLQPSCFNCQHSFEMLEHDAGPSYFCTLGAPTRPHCGSVLMCEMHNNWEEGMTGQQYHDSGEASRLAWDKWSDGREVAPHGTCGSYEGGLED